MKNIYLISGKFTKYSQKSVYFGEFILKIYSKQIVFFKPQFPKSLSPKEKGTF